MANLRKNMTIFRGVVMAICGLVGSGLLGLPGLAMDIGGLYSSSLAWLISIAISLPLVIIFMELSLKVQDAGGVATFSGMALGSWAETATAFTLAITFTFGIPLGIYMGGLYIQTIVGLSEDYLLWIVWSILALSTIVNYLGLKPASWLNTLSVASLIILIVTILFTHWDFLFSGIHVYSQAIQNIDTVSFNSVWSVCAVLFWAFLGWENMSFSSEEIAGNNAKETEKAIKWIFLLAFLSVSIIYLLLALLTAGASQYNISVNGVTGILALLENTLFSKIAYFLIILVVLANVNAWIFAFSRSLYASGKERILPKYLGDLNSDGIPRKSILTTFFLLSAICYLIVVDIIPLEKGLALANQNFIVIYVLSIICYLRVARGVFAYFIGFSGLVSCLFLIVGFGWFILIPLSLMGLGWLLHTVINPKVIKPNAK